MFWKILKGECACCNKPVIGIMVGEDRENVQWRHADGSNYRHMIDPVGVDTEVSSDEVAELRQKVSDAGWDYENHRQQMDELSSQSHYWR